MTQNAFIESLPSRTSRLRIIANENKQDSTYWMFVRQLFATISSFHSVRVGSKGVRFGRSTAWDIFLDTWPNLSVSGFLLQCDERVLPVRWDLPLHLEVHPGWGVHPKGRNLHRIQKNSPHGWADEGKCLKQFRAAEIDQKETPDKRQDHFINPSKGIDMEIKMLGVKSNFLTGSKVNRHPQKDTRRLLRPNKNGIGIRLWLLKELFPENRCVEAVRQREPEQVFEIEVKEEARV